MNKYLIILLLLLSFFRARAQREITVSGELRPFYDLSLLSRYSNSVEEGISSYDRTGGNDDGFNGTWSFVRRNPDSSLVMLDVQGPGVINRIATPTPTKDTLDIYIDHKLELSICYLDLFSGKVFPFKAPLCGAAVGGYYCYFPIPFNQSCKIVCRGKRLQFHQIQYRLYPKGTQIQSFNLKQDQEEQKALSAIQRLWLKHDREASDFTPGPLTQINKNGRLKPGQSITLLDVNRGGRINGIELDTAGAHDLWLHIEWDGGHRPAVDCPVAEFFGWYFGGPAMQSLLLGTRGNKTYCYFPMPFDKHAHIGLVNHSKSMTYNTNAVIWYSQKKRDTKNEGRFYTNFQTERLQANEPYHIFLNIKGKGHYVGTVLKAAALDKDRGTPFFEGDDSTATDGKFRIHGTGSEDYFNGGWYDLKGRWDHRESLPLSGCLGYSHQLAQTGGYRFMIGDKIPFEHSFYQNIEHGGSAKEAVPADYTSVSFYYSDQK